MASEIKANKISPATGTAFTIGDSGDTFTLPSGATLAVASGATISNAGTASGFGGTNTPAFYAYLSTSQVPTSGVWTKVQFDNEVYDTASAYDPTTNYRFTVPSGEGGKYFISGQARLLGSYLTWGQLAIYKNGTIIAQNGGQFGTNDYRLAINVSRVLELSAGDYIEIYAFLTGTSLNVEGANVGNDVAAFFGFKLVE
jgi:hypothetical protein